MFLNYSVLKVMLKKHPVMAFFALAFLINWTGVALNVAGIFPAFGEYPLMFDGHEVALFRGRRTLLNWAPNIAAVIVLSLTCGFQGIVRLFQKFCVWRVGMRWWVAVFFIPVFIVGFSIGIHLLMGGQADFRHIRSLLAVFGMRFLFSLSLGSIGEEAGWRGFAFPRMQEYFGPLASAVILGLVWGIFHWPTHIIRQVPLWYLPFFFLSIISLSILLAWIYNSTGSLLLVALFHNTLNAADVALTYSFAAVVPRVDLMPVMTLVMVLSAVFVSVKTKFSLGKKIPGSY